MHSLNCVLFEALRWKLEIVHNIHSPQERSKLFALTGSIWLPMVYLMLQVNTVVKLLQGIVSGIKFKNTAWIRSLGGLLEELLTQISVSKPARLTCL